MVDSDIMTQTLVDPQHPPTLSTEIFHFHSSDTYMITIIQNQIEENDYESLAETSAGLSNAPSGSTSGNYPQSGHIVRFP